MSPIGEKTVTVSNEETSNPTSHELEDIELVEGKRSKKGILLRPQPSNDPNDPLVGTSFTSAISVACSKLLSLELAVCPEIRDLSHNMLLRLPRSAQQQ